MSSKRTDRDREPGVSRRMFLQAGARVTTFAAVCATLGATIVSACMSPDDNSSAQANNGSGSGGGYGYGYGYGYGCGP